MCFKVQRGEHEKPKIATEDITCYKLFSKVAPNDSDNCFVSIKQGHLYVKGQRFSEEHPIDATGYLIEEGIHSYSDPCTIQYNQCWNQYCWNYWPDSIQVKCIIPKGTKYWFNPDWDAATNTPELGSYVSESIIIGTDLDVINHPSRK